MESARNAWIVNDFDKVITVLGPVQEGTDEDQYPEEIKAEINYLLGKAYFERAEKELSKYSMNTRMFQHVETSAYDDLEKAEKHFEESIWFDTAGNFSADSNYMIGRILDVGYLQDMERALESYKRAIALDPESESGQKAIERVKLLSEWFSNVGH